MQLGSPASLSSWPFTLIDNGRSSLLGTLIGGGAGALIGREIQRGSLRCR